MIEEEIPENSLQEKAYCPIQENNQRYSEWHLQLSEHHVCTLDQNYITSHNDQNKSFQWLPDFHLQQTNPKQHDSHYYPASSSTARLDKLVAYLQKQSFSDQKLRIKAFLTKS
eukprot:TRINITY_DN27569_c0_g1_i1.p2 TRINITY_DN27569_c0_g1~~TRINITY_DN27569_c0_g1_i1.p2  ORF type:complete len:113 (-),score=5.73 TRINITY_DN27569_c0_g1_i1:115-453(-)